MNEFFSMGGYAFYVWNSYGVSLVVLLILFLWPIKQRKTLIRQLARDKERQAKLARRQQ